MLRMCDPEEVGLSKVRLTRAELVAEKYVGSAYPGYDLLVLKDDCVVMRRVSGFAEVVPERRSLGVDYLFDVASLTKSLVTSTVYAKLVEEGLLSLRQKAVDVVPEFRLTVAGSNQAKERVELWMLLSHTSGLPAWLPLYKTCRDRDEVLAEALRSFPAYEPGTDVVYSDVNYIVLTYIAEKVTGERIDRLFEKLVSSPLKLVRTSFNPLKAGFSRSEIVATEVVDWRGGVIVGEVHDENAFAMDGVSGHAGLFTTTLDAAKIVFELLSSYRGTSDALISPVTASTFMRAWSCSNVCYGLGWQVYEPDRLPGTLVDARHSVMLGHTGFTGTSILISPLDSLAVVFFTNRVHPTRANEMIRLVRPLVHNTVLASIMRRH